MPQFKENFSLKPYNTFGIEVQTKYFYKVFDTLELKEILERNINLPFNILGGGSNILFTEDFKGLTLLIDNKGIEVLNETSKTVTVEVQAGENWHEFVLWCLDKNFGGIENLALAHLSFYPPCFFNMENLSFTKSPMHILVGRDDNL